MIRSALLCFVGLLLGITVAQGQPDNESVSRTLREELAAKEGPGSVVGVLSGTRTTCLAAVGIADMSTKTPVSTDMLFRLFQGWTYNWTDYATVYKTNEGHAPATWRQSFPSKGEWGDRGETPTLDESLPHLACF